MKSFYFITVDRDNCIFSVEGPIADDSALTNDVCKMQDQGKEVNGHTVSADKYQSIDEVVESCKLTYKDYSYSESPITGMKQ